MLRDILGVLRDSYCRTVGIEYMHIQDPEQRPWIQDGRGPYASPAREEQLRILRRLNAAEAFETFLQTKYVGQKRFSLEGGESVIPLLDRVLCRAADDRIDEVCIGMPHRGRLNVLANIAGKSYGQIFREFEGQQDPKSVQGSGDVKYHLGTEGEFTAEDGARPRSTSRPTRPTSRPSTRCSRGSSAPSRTTSPRRRGFTVLPVLMHGDAAFAGQGVVAETLNLTQLQATAPAARSTSSSTTRSASPRRRASRSSVYSTDVARMIQAPIFHVNGDDPEASSASPSSPTSSARRSTRTSSSTWSATAAAGTTRATTRR